MPLRGLRFRGIILNDRLPPLIEVKLQQLESLLGSWQRVLVLFSGGVDSTLLLKAAREIVGSGVTALTFEGPHCPATEMTAARKIAAELGVRHRVEPFDPLSLPDFQGNTPQRCYACKQALYARSWEIAAQVEAQAVLDGANADDAAADRPGLLAAAAMGIHSPLRETGWRKDEIRELSRRWGLAHWDRPAQSCLATRFPPNTPLDSELFQKVDRVEDFLRRQGFGPVRLRVHGELVRLEAPPEQWPGLLTPSVLEALRDLVRNLGWRYLTLDLQGYLSGSMNARPPEPGTN